MDSEGVEGFHQRCELGHGDDKRRGVGDTLGDLEWLGTVLPVVQVDDLASMEKKGFCQRCGLFPCINLLPNQRLPPCP